MDNPLSDLPKSDPGVVLRFRDRQFAAELIAVALLHVDLFSWLAEHPGATDETISQRFGFCERPTDVLMSLLRASGFVSMDNNGKNKLTQVGLDYLVKGSLWYLGPYYEPLRDSDAAHGFLKVLKTGKPANWQAKADNDDWHTSMLDPGFARNFTDLMNCRGVAFGQHLAKALGPMLGERRRLLDVGGGSGIYTSALLATCPNLTAKILEQPPVDAITRDEVTKHGFASRTEVISEDMFKMTWPSADIVLLSNVLHDWDFPEVRKLIAKAASALSPGGLLVIHEAFMANDKSGPLPVAEYSSLLMYITQGKCYTPNEYGRILAEFGLSVGEYCDTIADRGFMTGLKKS